MNDDKKQSQRTKINNLLKKIKNAESNIDKMKNGIEPFNKHQHRRKSKKESNKGKKDVDEKIREGFENLVNFIESLK